MNHTLKFFYLPLFIIGFYLFLSCNDPHQHQNKQSPLPHQAKSTPINHSANSSDTATIHKTAKEKVQPVKTDTIKSDKKKRDFLKKTLKNLPSVMIANEYAGPFLDECPIKVFYQISDTAVSILRNRFHKHDKLLLKYINYDNKNALEFGLYCDALSYSLYKKLLKCLIQRTLTSNDSSAFRNATLIYDYSYSPYHYYKVENDSIILGFTYNYADTLNHSTDDFISVTELTFKKRNTCDIPYLKLGMDYNTMLKNFNADFIQRFFKPKSKNFYVYLLVQPFTKPQKPTRDLAIILTFENNVLTEINISN